MSVGGAGAMRRVLLAVDFSDFTRRLLEVGTGVARAFGAEVYLVHAEAPEPEFVGWDVGPQSVRDSVARRVRQVHRDLQALADQARAAGLDATPLLVQGPATEKLLAEARRLGADLIVMGTHGHGRLHRLLLGSVGEGVLRQAPCPVLFVPLDRPAE
jgi:nucleotide-binding universal stress UspA family protein